ncbi:MAG: cbb3-type cytochrome c oxidase subunit 3 [Reyranella sp.]|nr:MAG: cbb3-type cytochrome c oxidase subunit 3 [Reyranella sp.]
MGVTYDEVVWFSKTFGLFYLIGFSALVLVYVYWPSNKATFERAAAAILHDEDKPCR